MQFLTIREVLPQKQAILQSRHKRGPLLHAVDHVHEKPLRNGEGEKQQRENEGQLEAHGQLEPEAQGGQGVTGDLIDVGVFVLHMHNLHDVQIVDDISTENKVAILKMRKEYESKR